MKWMFTDMDAYFASVEQMQRPELRGRPVGVIPVETDHTCVIAASYDAKRHGVKVGTGVREARQLCPGIVFVKARPQEYVKVHGAILRSVDQCVEVHQVYSIDEWSIRLRGEERDPHQARSLAQSIKRKLLEDFGSWLTCSIGIAPTRLLAKIASDMEKPDGLVTLSVDDLPGRIEKLSLKDLCGIGHNMVVRLNEHGIHTVRQLWEVNRAQSIQIWGSVSGADWWAGFHGHDEPEAPKRRRSMSHGNVLEPRFRSVEGACGILMRLVCKLGQRLRRNGYVARSLHISLRDERGRCFATEIGLPSANDTPTLLQQFHKIWEQRPSGLHSIKKVDAVVAGLIPESQVSRSLFGEAEKRQQLSKLMDRITGRWGMDAAYFAPIHEYRQPMENKIAFGRIPEMTEWHRSSE